MIDLLVTLPYVSITIEETDIFYPNIYVLGQIIVMQSFDIVFDMLLSEFEGIVQKSKDLYYWKNSSLGMNDNFIY